MKQIYLTEKQRNSLHVGIHEILKLKDKPETEKLLTDDFFGYCAEAYCQVNKMKIYTQDEIKELMQDLVFDHFIYNIHTLETHNHRLTGIFV